MRSALDSFFFPISLRLSRGVLGEGKKGEREGKNVTPNQKKNDDGHTRRSVGATEPDGAVKAVARAKIIHYRQVYLNHPDPIAFIPLVVDTLRSYLRRLSSVFVFACSS